MNFYSFLINFLTFSDFLMISLKINNKYFFKYAFLYESLAIDTFFSDFFPQK